MTSDDSEDIKAGLDSLRRAMRSIQTARLAVNSMPESYDKADAEIALTHAQEMGAVAERLFSSALAEEPLQTAGKVVDPDSDWTIDDLEPQVE